MSDELFIIERRSGSKWLETGEYYGNEHEAKACLELRNRRWPHIRYRVIEGPHEVCALGDDGMAQDEFLERIDRVRDWISKDVKISHENLIKIEELLIGKEDCSYE